jgi:predicted TIM-barrel fold metal-dependent hydrolase
MKKQQLTALMLFAALPLMAQITYESAPNAEQKKTLLLRDFHPRSMLHVPAHEVLRAKFPVIDVHQHVDDARGIGDHIPPKRLIQIMDATNVKKIVILTGMWGDKLQKVIDELVKPYPDRFIVFTQIDFSKIGDANFSDEMVQQLDDAVSRGARGLKQLKDLGLQDRDTSGKLIAVDDPRLDPIWEECGRLGIPVAIHTTDPEAFFTPVDGNNERYDELMENPSWSFYGKGLPSKQEILAQRDRMFAKHPQTKFIALHMANWPENLDYVANLLDTHPNVYVEFGAREAELGREPRRAREFFIKYQDRIMFGADFTAEEEMYRNHFRWLETNDEYFDYFGYPGQGRWKIYGMALPDGVLEKIYHLNAEKLFAEYRGLPARAAK